MPESNTKNCKFLVLAYFGVGLGVLYGLARILEERARLPRSLASTLAALGPWLAAWHNLALLIRGGG